MYVLIVFGLVVRTGNPCAYFRYGLLENGNLTHFHGIQSVLVAFRRYTRAAGGGDAYGKLREKCL